MPIQYSQRRARRERLLAALPEELRPLVSLRNVESIARLPKPALATLIQAAGMGLPSLPAALRLLSAQPDLTPEELILACQPGAPEPGDRDTAEANEARSETPAAEERERKTDRTRSEGEDDEAVRLLADTIRRCFPHVSPVSADSLASVPPLADLRLLAAGIRLALAAARGSEITSLIAEALLREALAGLQDGQAAGCLTRTLSDTQAPIRIVPLNWFKEVHPEC